MATVGPYAACYSSPAVLVFGVLLWVLVSLFMAVGALSDPGVIPRSVDDNSQPDDTVRRTKLINGVEFELKICTTCGIVRPPRSSHDSRTDRCVLKFDHFCIFLGNTVGRSNYLWFLCFVGLTSFGAIYFVSFSLWHVVHLTGRLEREAGLDSGSASTKAFGQAFLSAVIGIYFALMGFLVTVLFLLHCYFVSTGQTTYEFMKGAWKKRPNPFDKGLCANWVAVVRDVAVHRRSNGIDGNPTIETVKIAGTCSTAAPMALGQLNAATPPQEYVGAKIYSPREDRSPERLGVSPPKAKVKGPAEFQVHLGDQVITTTLSEKMLKKSLRKALIDPFRKQFKTKIDQVIVDGERADVKQPASAFVKQADRAVTVQLVRPGDAVVVSSNPV